MTAEPLVLELTLSYGSAELHQEIVVTEESDFRVITHIRHLRWNIEGHIGRIADGVAPVDLSFGAYYSATENTLATSPVKLRVDEYTGRGWGDGRLMIRGLWLRRGLDSVPVLTRSLAERRDDFPMAVYRLGQLGQTAKAAVPELIGVLTDVAVDRDRKPHESRRGDAAEALGKIGPAASAAVESLLKATHDENPHLRLDAALALWQIAKHPAAVPAAIKELSHDDHFVRYKAAGALREIGPNASDAAPALSAALSDADGYMRAEAAWSLWAIRRDPAAIACLRDVSEHDPQREVREFAASLLRAVEEQQAADQPE